MKIIITGGPGFGKTTIINTLEALGYPVFHEVARDIIQREIETQGTKTPWQDVMAFSEEVLQGRIEQYKASQVYDVVFIDRGIPDIVAFLNKDALEVAPHYQTALHEYRYHGKVFITPPWEAIFINDTERKEDYQLAVELDRFITQAYETAGYEVIPIPTLSPEERATFILNHLGLASRQAL